jgi:hypothetical protein
MSILSDIEGWMLYLIISKYFILYLNIPMAWPMIGIVGLITCGSRGSAGEDHNRQQRAMAARIASKYGV